MDTHCEPNASPRTPIDFDNQSMGVHPRPSTQHATRNVLNDSIRKYLVYTHNIDNMCIDTGRLFVMGRTNVVLDDELVEECKKLTGIATRRSLIEYALNEVRRRGRQRRLLELQGTVKWEGDLETARKART
jgi:Arc/MetJ family transcription regulator